MKKARVKGTTQAQRLDAGARSSQEKWCRPRKMDAMDVT